METLKFLMTTSFYPPHHIGGDAVFVQYLAEELAKQGHEVHVFSSIDSYQLKTHRKLHKNPQDSSVTIHSVKSPFGILSPLSAYAFGSSSYYSERFSDLVHDIKPHVVHHHNVSLLGHPILKRKGNYLSIHTTHDFWLVCPTYGLITYKGESCNNKRCLFCTIAQRRFPQVWRQSKILRREIKDLDLIITPSEFFKGILEKEIENRIAHIPNFSPIPPKKIEESDYKDFFLFAGSMDRAKGLDGLIELVKQQDVQIKLFVAGNGKLKSKIEKTIKQRGLENKIILVGWVNHNRMYSLMRNANALIVPSMCFENSPLIALEALSVGTPVIASNNGGLPEIVGKVDKALIFNEWAGLREIIARFSRADFPAEPIKQVYTDFFSPEAHIGRYLNALNDLN